MESGESPPDCTSSGSSRCCDKKPEKVGPSPSLYRPIIFQYKCRGGLFIDEDGDKQRDSGDNVGIGEEDQKRVTPSEHGGVYVLPKSLSTPSCIGLESRLKKLQELQPMTKEESLRAFMWHTDNAEGAYESAPQDHRKEDDEAQNSSSRYPQKRQGNGAFSTMAFYGSTDVSVLMLRDAKKAEVVAVAPDCKLGLTIREAGDNTGGESFSTLRVGPVEVTVGNHYEYQEKDQPNHNNNQSHEQNLTNQINHTNQHSLLQQNNNKDHKDTSLFPNSDKNQQSEQDYFKKVVYALSKTAENMQNNAKIIKDELRDDFPSRVVKAGDKIAGNFGRTMDRTKKVVLDVYKMWSDDNQK